VRKDRVTGCVEESLDRIHIKFNTFAADDIDTKIFNVVTPFYLQITTKQRENRSIVHFTNDHTSTLTNTKHQRNGTCKIYLPTDGRSNIISFVYSKQLKNN